MAFKYPKGRNYNFGHFPPIAKMPARSKRKAANTGKTDAQKQIDEASPPKTKTPKLCVNFRLKIEHW